MSNRDDVLIWVASKLGQYSIKEGYNTLQQGCNSKVSSRACSFCWNDIVLPKANYFPWLTLNKRILTTERLVKLGITQAFNCVFCDLEEESVDHLFLHCSFASQCWSFIMNKLQLMLPFPKSLWDMFNSWPLLFSTSTFSGIWKCAPAHIIWAIWWERNKRIFGKTSSSLDQVLIKLENLIAEIINSSLTNSKDT